MASAEKERRSIAGPHEPASHRPPHLELVPGTDLVVEERGHLIGRVSLDRYLDLR
jgi:hypothetical protein